MNRENWVEVIMLLIPIAAIAAMLVLSSGCGHFPKCGLASGRHHVTTQHCYCGPHPRHNRPTPHKADKEKLRNR